MKLRDWFKLVDMFKDKSLYNLSEDQLEQEFGEYQGGFIPRWKCAHQIITLKLVMDIKKRGNKSLCLSISKKYYDLYTHTNNVECIKKFWPYLRLISMIKFTLTNTNSQIKFKEELPKPFTIKSGSRQGDDLSLLLFNCALEDAIKEYVTKKILKK